jgi:hypothetical protein
MGKRARDTGLRASVRHIYMLARGIRDGTRVPVVTLTNIIAIAHSSRRRRMDGTLEPLEESPLWAVYAPFHPVTRRWVDLQARGELTPELANELQVEMYSAACALLGESRSHRPTTAVVMYERGRLVTNRPEAAGMANFIISQCTRERDHNA